MQQHGNVLAYFNHTDFPSHMYPAGFWYRGIFFEQVEKFIMFSKAKTFNDEESAQEILLTDNPYLCKSIGKKTRGFRQDVWDQWSSKIALVGNREKYRQNPPLATLLVQSHPFVLAEASWNRKWGAGFAKGDARIGDTSLWTGQNLGGNTVMQVRTELMNGQLR